MFDWRVILGLAGSVVGLFGGVVGTIYALKALAGSKREQKLCVKRYLGVLWMILIIPIIVLTILTTTRRVPVYYLSLLATLPLVTLPLTLSANRLLKR